jgi:hypothetical protein
MCVHIPLNFQIQIRSTEGEQTNCNVNSVILCFFNPIHVEFFLFVSLRVFGIWFRKF